MERVVAPSPLYPEEGWGGLMNMIPVFSSIFCCAGIRHFALGGQHGTQVLLQPVARVGGAAGLQRFAYRPGHHLDQLGRQLFAAGV